MSDPKVSEFNLYSSQRKVTLFNQSDLRISRSQVKFIAGDYRYVQIRNLQLSRFDEYRYNLMVTYTKILVQVLQFEPKLVDIYAYISKIK